MSGLSGDVPTPRLAMLSPEERLARHQLARVELAGLALSGANWARDALELLAALSARNRVLSDAIEQEARAEKDSPVRAFARSARARADGAGQNAANRAAEFLAALEKGSP